MRHKSIIIFLITVFVISCKSESQTKNDPPSGSFKVYTSVKDSALSELPILKAIYGEPSHFEEVDYEHCFEGDDTVKSFYKMYNVHPDYDYAIARWDNVDSTGENMTLYLMRMSGEEYFNIGSREDNYKAFWGYRCRPEDFTTDIYKVE